MARNSFLLASISFETRCQWPIVTPVELNGAGCAVAFCATSDDASSNAAKTRFFKRPSRITHSPADYQPVVKRSRVLWSAHDTGRAGPFRVDRVGVEWL